MKKILIIPALSVIISITILVIITSANPVPLKDCKCKNIELKGRVRVVTIGADFRVKVVTSLLPDLRVKKVTIGPVKCGEWQFVDIGEDFTIQFVDEFPDFTIEYVEVGPGIN